MLAPSSPHTSAFMENRARRRFVRLQEMRRLRRNAETLIAAHPMVTGLGGNDDAEDAAISCGLDLDDFAVFDVRVGSRRATLVCVPTRNWNDPTIMKVFFRAKAAISELGHTAVLVPQAFIQRQPRLDTASDRMAILAHLIENGNGTLWELAMLVKSLDPVSAILHLTTTGALRIDLNSAITPASILTMGEPAQ
jgi:hypothetical protein